MNKRLLKIARYLGQKGLYHEAAQIKKLAESPGVAEMSAEIRADKERKGESSLPYNIDPENPYPGQDTTEIKGWENSPGATGGRGWFNDNDWTISAIELYEHAPNILAYIKSSLNLNKDSYDFVIDDGRLLVQNFSAQPYALPGRIGYGEIPVNYNSSGNWKAEASWIVARGASEGIVEAKYYLDSILGARNPGGYRRSREEMINSLEVDPYITPRRQ